MRGRVAVAVALLVLTLSFPSGPALASNETAAHSVGPRHSASNGLAVPQQAGNQTIVIALQANGDANWTISTAVSLESEAERSAFRELAADWRNGTADVQPDGETVRRYARLATEATQRNMSIPTESIERTATIEGDRGILRLSFTWTNFGRTDGDTLIIDDAFQRPGGTWLDGLTANQRLVILPPAEYTFQSAPPGARLVEGALVWTGPEQFDAAYFLGNPVVFIREDETPTTTTVTDTVTETSTVTTSASPGPSGGSDQGLLLGILAAVIVGGGLWLYRRRGGSLSIDRGGPPAETGAGEADVAPDSDSAAPTDEQPAESATEGGVSTGEEPETAAGTAGTSESPGPSDSAAEPASTESTDESTTGQTGADGAGTSGTTDPFAGVDEELLSDEERILRLVSANGGRMKQATIVTETGWSNAKVSQLLSSMEDDDQIDKLRIGRENLISLPDVDVGDVE